MRYMMFAISDVFFFNDTATTEIYTLSLHDALPISDRPRVRGRAPGGVGRGRGRPRPACRLLRGAGGTGGVGPPRPRGGDRKSTRLNSSHANISYAVFCLKKKTEKHQERRNGAIRRS